MKTRYIKTNIKNSNCNGSKAGRNNRADNVGASVRYKRAIKDYKESIIGDCKGINRQEAERLKTQWIKLGGTLKSFNRIGTIKVKELLK